MKDLLKQTLNILKERVQYNLTLIRKNEKVVKEILQEPVSSNRSEKLNERYAINKIMLEENNDSIKLQLSIIQFLDKYEKQFDEFIQNTQNDAAEYIQKTNSEKLENIVEMSKDDYFDLTINNGITFNEEHPYFKDDDFLNRLLEYYTYEEKYEVCTKLIAERNKNNDLIIN